ncbi:MAG: EamA family transporter [Robiginitomaculum sp.]|nr:EamA family transporter [Robiginitomaculum sp.]
MAHNKALFYGACLAIILIWGTAYTFVGFIVDTISPAWMVAVRTTIAAFVLVTYALLRRHRFPSLRDKVWRWYGFMGFVGMALPFYLSAHGQIEVDSGLTAILAGVMPLITIVLAHFFVQDERLTVRKTLGFFIGFVGIIYLFLPVPFKWEMVQDWQSQGLILLTALCYAILTIIAKRAPEIAPSLGAAIMVISAAILSVTYALATGIPQTMPPRSALIALLFLSLGATAIAQILYLRLIQISGPSFVAKLVYLVPVASIIAGIVYLDEVFSWRLVGAMLVIFIGLLIAKSDKKPGAKSDKKPG